MLSQTNANNDPQRIDFWICQINLLNCRMQIRQFIGNVNDLTRIQSPIVFKFLVIFCRRFFSHHYNYWISFICFYIAAMFSIQIISNCIYRRIICLGSRYKVNEVCRRQFW